MKVYFILSGEANNLATWCVVVVVVV